MDEMNDNINTVIVAPMTTIERITQQEFHGTFQDKIGQIVLDQIRTTDKVIRKKNWKN